MLATDVLDEQPRKYVILVLADIHPTPQFIATSPQGSTDFRFLKGHFGLTP